MRPDGPRDPVTGPDSGPEKPFPIKLSGRVVTGFGRGSKELGIPTANIPPEGLSAYPSLASGVYYGFAGLSLPDSDSVYPAVLSIGYNPFYKNDTRSVEIHILHYFHYDFYGAPLNLLMLGYIRPEYDYLSRDSLIEDIKTDCDVARRSLKRETYQEYREERWLRDFDWAKTVDMAKEEAKVFAKV